METSLNTSAGHIGEHHHHNSAAASYLTNYPELRRSVTRMDSQRQAISHKMELLRSQNNRSVASSRERSPEQKLVQAQRRLNLYKDANLLLRLRSRRQVAALKEKYRPVHEKHREAMGKAPTELARKYGSMIFKIRQKSINRVISFSIEQKKTNEWKLPNLIEDVRRLEGEIKKKQLEDDSNSVDVGLRTIFVNRNEESYQFNKLRQMNRKSTIF